MNTVLFVNATIGFSENLFSSYRNQRTLKKVCLKFFPILCKISIFKNIVLDSVISHKFTDINACGFVWPK